MVLAVLAALPVLLGGTVSARASGVQVRVNGKAAHVDQDRWAVWLDVGQGNELELTVEAADRTNRGGEPLVRRLQISVATGSGRRPGAKSGNAPVHLAKMSNGVGMDLIYLKAGTFWMGSPPSEADRPSSR